MAQLPDGWTSHDKFAAVLEAASLSGAKLEDFFCRRGLHRAQVESWRSQMLAALGDSHAHHHSAEGEQSFLARALAAIDENIADERFQVGALAARLAMSRSLLYRRLEEIGQPPPARLILERRLGRAAELLAYGTVRVSDVADAVGFGSASHFTYCFRQHFGLAPSAYRSRYELRRSSPLDTRG